MSKRMNELELSGVTFYFKGSSEDVIYKFVPEKGYFVKWPGKSAKKVSPETSRLLMDSILEFTETTKKNYDNI